MRPRLDLRNNANGETLSASIGLKGRFLRCAKHRRTLPWSAWTFAVTLGFALGSFRSRSAEHPLCCRQGSTGEQKGAPMPFHEADGPPPERNTSTIFQLHLSLPHVCPCYLPAPFVRILSQGARHYAGPCGVPRLAPSSGRAASADRSRKQQTAVASRCPRDGRRRQRRRWGWPPAC